MAPLISRHIHASIAVEDPGTCAAILAAVQHLRKQLGRVFALRMQHDHTAQYCDNRAASPRSRVGPGLGGGGSFGCARCCNFGRRRKVALKVVDSFDDAYSNNAAAVEPDNRTSREFVTNKTARAFGRLCAQSTSRCGRGAGNRQTTPESAAAAAACAQRTRPRASRWQAPAAPVTQQLHSAHKSVARLTFATTCPDALSSRDMISTTRHGTCVVCTATKGV